MTIYEGPPPAGFIFVREPSEATHVYDYDGSIIDLNGPNACYSRSLRGWMKKIENFYDDSVEANLKRLDDLATGDEIHFTDGTIWCCNFLRWVETDQFVVFVPLSFQQIRDGAWVKDYFWPEQVQSLIYDAVRGGAKVLKGVGLAKDEELANEVDTSVTN